MEMYTWVIGKETSLMEKADTRSTKKTFLMENLNMENLCLTLR